MERLTHQAELPGKAGRGGRDQTNEFSIRITRFVRGAARGGGALETKEGGALELGRAGRVLDAELVAKPNSLAAWPRSAWPVS